MDSNKIKQIRNYGNSHGNHKEAMDKFGLNYAQTYAIRILARDKRWSDDYVASKIDNVKEGMVVGEIMKAMSQ